MSIWISYHSNLYPRFLSLENIYFVVFFDRNVIVLIARNIFKIKQYEKYWIIADDFYDSSDWVYFEFLALFVRSCRWVLFVYITTITRRTRFDQFFLKQYSTWFRKENYGSKRNRSYDEPVSWRLKDKFWD